MGEISFRLIEHVQGPEAAQAAQNAYREDRERIKREQEVLDELYFDVDPTNMGRDYNEAAFYQAPTSAIRPTNATIGSDVIALAAGPAWLAPEGDERCPVIFVKNWGQPQHTDTK
ncbi:MAG TPA: hypothetical protein VFI74_04160 [Candidatus Saccharimonadales bacterium]|nr:hypothetical protein [Candidatus Saccharimonadales bacterium]